MATRSDHSKKVAETTVRHACESRGNTVSFGFANTMSDDVTFEIQRAVAEQAHKEEFRLDRRIDVVRAGQSNSLAFSA